MAPPPDTDPDPLPGATIGGYVLRRLLGSGGFASVYLGEHVSLRRRAAIKVLMRANDPDALRKTSYARRSFSRTGCVRVPDSGGSHAHEAWRPQPGLSRPRHRV
jgi:serine/threonine protein kinase